MKKIAFLFIKISIIVFVAVMFAQFVIDSWAYYRAKDIWELPWHHDFEPPFIVVGFASSLLALYNTILISIRELKRNKIGLKAIFTRVLVMYALFCFMFIFFRITIEPLYLELLVKHKTMAETIYYLVSSENISTIFSKATYVFCGLLGPILLVFLLLLHIDVLFKARAKK